MQMKMLLFPQKARNNPPSSWTNNNKWALIYVLIPNDSIVEDIGTL